MSVIEYTAGDKIGDYIVQSQLGKGGMSVVYKGHDEEADIDVAIKVLHPNLLTDTDAIQRFEREMEAVSRIKHRNIAQVFSCSRTEENVPFLVMEYIDGHNFAQLIQSKADFSLTEITGFMIQAVEGFRAAFDQKIIHRDIKPQNLMLNYQDVVKILDFGMAKVIGADGHKSVEGTIIGTPYYMSPEMAAGRPIDHRGDIYSLGASFYHILARRTLFDGDTPLGIMLKQSTAQPQPLYIHNPRVTQGLWEIIERMLQKDPNDRYQNYDELLSDLRQEQLAIKNKEKRETEYSRQSEMAFPIQTSAFESAPRTLHQDAPGVIPSTSSGSPLIEEDRRKRAMQVDVDKIHRSNVGMVILILSFIVVIGGIGLLIRSFYGQGLSASDGGSGNIMGKIMSGFNPANWFAKKDVEEGDDYDRGVITYDRMKALQQAIILYESEKNIAIENLGDITENRFTTSESLRDGWGNEIVYIASQRTLIAPGKDGIEDTEDDFVLGSEGRFINLPPEFVRETLERESRTSVVNP